MKVLLAREKISLILKQRGRPIYIPSKRANFGIEAENLYKIMISHTNKVILLLRIHPFWYG